MTGLAGRRILVVEDEMLIAMVVETVLGDAGCEIVGPVGKLVQAVRLAEQAEIDAALLDVNLSGQEVFPAADALAARNIPFVFVTGYGTGGLPTRFKHRPILTKPYRAAAVVAALEALLPVVV